MSAPHLSDKELQDIFAARLDPLFESFFDHSFPVDPGPLPPSFESSDSSGSTDTLLFDSISTGSSSTSFGVTDLSPSSVFDLALRPAHKAGPPPPSTNGAPRTRKLVHQLRPDGPGISGSELLSIEGQAQAMPVRANGQSHAMDHDTSHCPPSTPPITPNPQRVRPRTSTSPIRKQRVASKRSKGHSTKAAAAAVAAAAAAAPVPELPSIPYATLRMKAPSMLQTAGRATPVEIPHRPGRLPPSPPSSSRFPTYEHSSMSLIGSGHGHGSFALHSQAAFSEEGFEAGNYAAHDKNAFVSASSDDMAVLSSPWPRAPESDCDYAVYSAWDSTTTPVFDNATPLYDMPIFSAIEPTNPYFFNASLASTGLMIQYDQPRDSYTSQPTIASGYNYSNQHAAHASSTQPTSPSAPMHPCERGSEIEPPPITLPKRGGSSKSLARRNTVKHMREVSRSAKRATTSLSASSPIPDTSVEAEPGSKAKPRQRPRAQHTPSQSTGNIRSVVGSGSLRAHKSTGSLATVSANSATVCLPSARSSGLKSSGGAKNSASKGNSTLRASASKISLDKSADTKAASGMIGFVNFTPSDSRKILTGVAPSGSSKTKARREREAIERRRRLSEAAAKAVRDAGGDLTGLWRDGGLDGEAGWRWEENFGADAMNEGIE